jgi:serine/threonine-protein kinase
VRVFCPRCGKQYESKRSLCFDCGMRLQRSVSTSAFRSVRTTKVGIVLGNRYELKGLLGQGASSRVYLADDLVAKRPVALKAFGPTSPAARARFDREAEVMMAVRHPNVIRIFDVGAQSNGAPFFVLELLRGETLGDYLRREKRVAPELALDLVRQAAAGLAAAHAVGVVHRDVKPDNLYLVGDPGEPFGLKLIDFGLAKLQARSSKSSAGVVLGTVSYMAPEQILCEPLDARADVYALGVTLFRTIAGELPFDGAADLDVLAQHLFAPAPSLAAREPSVDMRVDIVLRAALRKNPENRYATMEAMRDDLARLVGLAAGEPTGAPLRKPRDAYEPRSDAGRATAHALRAHWPGP